MSISTNNLSIIISRKTTGNIISKYIDYYGYLFSNIHIKLLMIWLLYRMEKNYPFKETIHIYKAIESLEIPEFDRYLQYSYINPPPNNILHKLELFKCYLIKNGWMNHLDNANYYDIEDLPPIANWTAFNNELNTKEQRRSRIRDKILNLFTKNKIKS